MSNNWVQVEYKVRIRLEGDDAELDRATKAAFEIELARFLSSFNKRTEQPGMPARVSCFPMVREIDTAEELQRQRLKDDK